MKVERIRKAYEQVADQLLNMINSGELKPGDRLPSEAELAADFGVSRTTVREALRILATRNLIQTRKGMAGGHFIVEPTVGSISEFLVASYGLLTAANTVTLEHLLQAREMIEGPAAALAARNRDESDLERIRTTLTDDISALSQADALEMLRNFHLYLLEATKNQLLVVAAAPIFTILQSTIVRRRPTKEVIAQLMRDHQEIYVAVAAGDEAEARRLMDEHLGYLRVNYQPGIYSTEGFDQPKAQRVPAPGASAATAAG
jgi:GntR family transcriptional regulator, transcriptional repressor for pyruvate dehydrogenase complex